MMDAPSAIALACSTCGAFVTPCLVCAHPILPFRTTTLTNVWKDCSHCGARNPIHDMLRYALGLPPALALSLPMASLAQMAFINRRDYILGMHAKSEEVKGACPLYFRECQGIVMLESQPEFQKNIDAARYGTSEKRTNEGNLLLPKHKHSADCHTSTSLKRPRSYSDECPECGASKDTYIGTAPAKDLIQSDMQTQRLLCAEGLYEDLECLSIPYPICRPNQHIARFYQKGVSVGSKRDSCRYSQKFSNISLELLKVANTALFAHMSSSETIDMGLKTPLQTLIEDVMEATGHYLVNRPALIDIQVFPSSFSTEWPPVTGPDMYLGRDRYPRLGWLRGRPRKTLKLFRRRVNFYLRGIYWRGLQMRSWRKGQIWLRNRLNLLFLCYKI